MGSHYEIYEIFSVNVRHRVSREIVTSNVAISAFFTPIHLRAKNKALRIVKTKSGGSHELFCEHA
jgi:hypothetical protein